MSTTVKEVRTSKLFVSKEILRPLSIFEDEAGMSELELAKSRRNGEFTSGEEYRDFLNNLINEAHNNKKGL